MKTRPLSVVQCGKALSVGEDGPIVTQNDCK